MSSFMTNNNVDEMVSSLEETTWQNLLKKNWETEFHHIY